MKGGYDHKKIELKWQKKWLEEKAYQAKDEAPDKDYLMIEFPYPSGEGLHVGHVRSWTALDVVARKHRAQGKNVLYPIGWDAFGLPAENYAIKTGVHPKITTKTNIDNFRRQIRALGLSFDWSREVNTTDPAYYKWTQWIFLQLFRKGLAYKTKTLINWCPKDQVTLANEEVVDGACERCGTPVEKREKEQWMLAITKYAQRLYDNLDAVDYIERAKVQQRNWIGPSNGARITFPIQIDDPTFTQTTEPGRVRENEPFVEREAIFAIVKHWSEDKYIGLRWKKVDWETVITGGVEEGQTPEEAAIAEIREETGYQHPVFVRTLTSVHSKFYHVPKAQNRHGHFHVLYFELADEARTAITSAEEANHEVVWLTKEEMNSFRLPASHRFAWNELTTGSGDSVEVFTTRPDTIFGATYLVVAPEHKLVSSCLESLLVSNATEVREYVDASKRKSEQDRTTETKEKTGVLLKGIAALNPATNERIPVYVADYVLGGYGTGAIMAVPAHDERDYAFAQAFGLPVQPVVIPRVVDETNPHVEGKEVVFRRSVIAAVFDPKTNQYLALKWKQQPWTTFVMGGIEEGEDPVEAARREVREETGYEHLKYIRTIGGPTQSEFYAAHKGVNRVSHTTALLFEITNETTRSPRAKEEEDAYELAWISPQDVSRATISHAEIGIIMDRIRTAQDVYTGDGMLVNSGEYSGRNNREALPDMAAAFGMLETTFKLRDWVFGRQRYWGEPIPLINCDTCGWVAVPEDQLPVLLPETETFQPGKDGESPLASMNEWVDTECPQCGGAGKRETDVMPQWAGSSWYWLRYTDPNNDKALADKAKLDYWVGSTAPASSSESEGGVDWYNGGMEHTVLHLLYSRFWNLFLYDIGVVPTEEPYKKRTSHGLIMAADGSKMSKSKGNVVNPDTLVESVGADSLRLYEMFLGPFDQPVAWDENGVVGMRRFLERVEAMRPEQGIALDPELETVMHQTIKKVTEDVEGLKMNTAVSALMVFLNKLESAAVPLEAYRVLLQLLAPFAPHLANELWERSGEVRDLNTAPWPAFDPAKTQSQTATIAIQINGRTRETMQLPANSAQDVVEQYAREAVASRLEGQAVSRVIVIPNRLVNFVLE